MPETGMDWGAGEGTGSKAQGWGLMAYLHSTHFLLGLSSVASSFSCFVSGSRDGEGFPVFVITGFFHV